MAEQPKRPKKYRSVAWRLFNTPYEVSIPEIYFHTEEAIQERGLYSSGDRNVDQTMRHGLRTVYMPIVGMALHRHEGSPIRLANPRNAVEIYDLIMQHLLNWNRVVNTEFNIGEVPIDDLKILENFAGEIHPLATQFTTQPLKKSERVDIFTNRSLNRLSQRLLEGNKEKEEEAKIVKVEPHKPLMDMLARRYKQHGG